MLASCGRHRILDAGPMLQNMGTNSVTVVWWQSHAESAVVILRDTSGQVRRVPARRAGSRFEARVDDLQPSTTYDYGVECGSETHSSAQVSGRLRTAPTSGTPFSFVVLGDSGSGTTPQYRLAGVLNRHPAALVLHTGDLIYGKGGTRGFADKFFRPYRALISSVPFYPVLGNHDIYDVNADNGKPFLGTFSLPTNGPSAVQAGHCYWFDYGDARFVGIDSNLDTQTLSHAVAPWLRKVLETSRGGWKFVFFHHPPWAGGGRPPDAKVRDALVPAIEAGGADIVFCGHNHLYERTRPMLGGEISPTNGVLYITSAAGGGALHKEKHGGEPYLAAFNDSKHSFTWIDVNGPRLELMQISEDDDILDKVVLGPARPPQPNGGARILP